MAQRTEIIYKAMIDINLEAFDAVPQDTASLFVWNYLAAAKKIQKETGLHYIAILTQAALESAWGTRAPGNMFFGVKDTDGINGNEQLLTTTEYSSNPNLKFPEVISVVPVTINGRKMYKYKVKDYFRKFDTPEDSFRHHVDFLFSNPRYKRAMEVRYNYQCFFEEVAKAGYATAPDYAKTLLAVSKSVINRLP